MIHQYAVILTGGYSPERKTVESYARGADFIVAADSGYDVAIKYGIEVDYLVGDMDSIRNRALIQGMPEDKVSIVSQEKDETDTELALQKAWDEGFGDTVLIGGGGGRLDHVIGILWLFERRRHPRIWVTDNETVAVIERSINFKAEKGERISIFPICDEVKGLESEGLQWSLNDLEWKRGDMGLSNIAVDTNISIRLQRGKLLLIRENRNGVIYV